MCAHADHQIKTLPDGQVDETHIFSNAELVRVQAAVNRMMWQMRAVGYSLTMPVVVS